MLNRGACRGFESQTTTPPLPLANGALCSLTAQPGAGGPGPTSGQAPESAPPCPARPREAPPPSSGTPAAEQRPQRPPGRPRACSGRGARVAPAAAWPARALPERGTERGEDSRAAPSPSSARPRPARAAGCLRRREGSPCARARPAQQWSRPAPPPRPDGRSRALKSASPAAPAPFAPSRLLRRGETDGALLGSTSQPAEGIPHSKRKKRCCCCRHSWTWPQPAIWGLQPRPLALEGGLLLRAFLSLCGSSVLSWALTTEDGGLPRVGSAGPFGGGGGTGASLLETSSGAACQNGPFATSFG
ncbi:translation initiation factor IF-2-like [Eublepharis macularius]|uniref:Translation initiation factor IF-2-like n=1 Tax=Eublepharis macularius TaxID=481883 RepID=A0AA97L9X4_EUBMA|nr:translation initiation factor IF-2-like [Eublepharis macularius]